MPCAVASHVKPRARARAAPPSAARRSGRATRSRTPATSSAGSSASRPVWPSTIDSLQAADAHRRARRAAGGGLDHGQAPALGRRGGQRHPRPREQACLLLLVDVAVEGHAVGERAALHLGLERGPVVAVAGDVEVRLGNRLEHVEQQLDALVLLQAPEVEQRRFGRLRPRREKAGIEAEVDDVDALALDAEGDEVLARGLRDREHRDAGIEDLQRHLLEQEGGDAPAEPELGDVVLLMDVEDQQDARLAHPAPQRREEGDPVEDLEHDVGVAPEAAQGGPRRAREDRQPRAHPVHGEALVEVRDPLGAGVVAGDHGDPVTPRHPAADLAVEVRAGAAALWMGPVAIGEDEDVAWDAHARGDATIARRACPASHRRCSP